MNTSDENDRHSTSGKLNRDVVLLSPFYAPERISTGRYNSFLGQAIKERGARLSVICAHPIYPEWRPSPVEYIEPGVRIFRGGSGLRFPRSAVLRRIILELWFLFFSRREGHKVIDPDSTHVIAVIPPVMFIRFLPKSRNLTVIVHDLQGVMAVSSSGLARKIIAKLMRVIERNALLKAERIVVLSKSMKDELLNNYKLPRSRIGVFYPFYTIQPEQADGGLLEKIMPHDREHVVYSGALGEKQRPEQLCVILDGIARKTNAISHIFSAGPAFESMRKRAAEEDWRIQFHPLVEDDALAELYRRSSIQLVPQASGTSSGAFPSKLPNLLVAGVPVLAICDEDSEVADVINDVGGGGVVHSWETDVVVKAAQALLMSRGSRKRQIEKAKQMFGVESLLEWLGC